MRGYALAVIELSVFQAFLAGCLCGAGCELGLLPLRCLRALGWASRWWVSVFSDSRNGGFLMSLVLRESTARGSCPSELANTRRLAYENGRPLLPRLADLGVHVFLGLPGVGWRGGDACSPGLRPVGCCPFPVSERRGSIAGGWAEQGAREMPALPGRIGVSPYSRNSGHAVSHVVFEVIPAERMESLGPEELGAVITKVRSHLDAMGDLRDRLVDARTTYRAMHS